MKYNVTNNSENHPGEDGRVGRIIDLRILSHIYMCMLVVFGFSFFLFSFFRRAGGGESQKDPKVSSNRLLWVDVSRFVFCVCLFLTFNLPLYTFFISYFTLFYFFYIYIYIYLYLFHFFSFPSSSFKSQRRRGNLYLDPKGTRMHPHSLYLLSSMGPSYIQQWDEKYKMLSGEIACKTCFAAAAVALFFFTSFKFTLHHNFTLDVFTIHACM